MKTAKKLMLVVLMVVTMIGTSAGSVYAESFPNLPSGKEQSVEVSYFGGTKTYQMVLSKKQTVTFDLYGEISNFDMYVVNTSGAKVKCSNVEFSHGSGSITSSYLRCNWNSVTGYSQCTAKYELDKGTYYIQLSASTYSTSGKVKIKATYGSNKDSNAVISYLTLELDEGDTIRLGAVVEPSDAKVTWKSSKAKVASVSSNGKVTAKKTGTTIITAKSGDSTVKIQIKVV